MMTRYWHEQGKCNPSLKASISYLMATLHGSDYWKTLEFQEDIWYQVVAVMGSQFFCIRLLGFG